MTNANKTPRIYVTQALSLGHDIEISDNAHHYLKNVMRTQKGDFIRLFNGRDGEFLGQVKDIHKKHLVINIQTNTRAQTSRLHKTALIFSPLKKERNDIMIEKAVELGASDFHPVILQNNDVRKINEERVRAQMIEAAEQSERLDIPALHPILDLQKFLSSWNNADKIFAAIERMDAQSLRRQNIIGNRALLVGPAGGFTDHEKEILSSRTFITPISLGGNILRAETAAMAGLSLLNL